MDVTRIGVTGHQQIPAEGLPSIEARATALIDRLSHPPTAVCSLAEGADQLVARLALEAGGKLEVIVPCENYRSVFDSAAGVEFDALMLAASRVKTLAFAEPSEQAFWAAGKEVVEESDVLLAIWDGQASRGVGGTADVVAYADSLGVMTEVIWPTGLRR